MAKQQARLPMPTRFKLAKLINDLTEPFSSWQNAELKLSAACDCKIRVGQIRQAAIMADVPLERIVKSASPTRKYPLELAWERIKSLEERIEALEEFVASTPAGSFKLKNQ